MRPIPRRRAHPPTPPSRPGAGQPALPAAKPNASAAPSRAANRGDSETRHPPDDRAFADLLRRAHAWERQRGPLRNDWVLLDGARILFELRSAAMTAAKELAPPLRAAERQLLTAIERRLRLTTPRSPLVEAIRGRKLPRLDRELLMAVALRTLDSLRRDRHDIGTNDVLVAAALDDSMALRAAARLRPWSRLACEDLLVISDDGYRGSRPISLAPVLLDGLLDQVDPGSRPGFRVRTQEQLLDRCHALILVLPRRGSHHGNFPYLPREKPESRKLRSVNRSIEAYLAHLRATARRHRAWPLSQVILADLDDIELSALLTLLGHTLGVLRHGDFQAGTDLLRCCVEDATQARRHVHILSSQGTLRRSGLIRVVGGPGDYQLIEDNETLLSCSYELSDEALSRMGLASRRPASGKCRPPLLRHDQVVLSADAEKALAMAAAQVHQADQLNERWGLAKAIPYGRGVTMIFWGPPGVGKTAAAEALADRLGKKILAVNYGEVQSKWVGETEKNITTAFRAAQRDDAVLFWDEADSMLGNRERATKLWEVRETNVLLQEIEHFQGVCILATNRVPALDPALDRRISLKVEFRRPDAAAARRIWGKLLPPELPLGSDVDVDAMACRGLSGGQIKNVVLNAARSALLRGVDARVEAADFESAIAMELGMRRSDRRRVGFTYAP